MDFSKQFFKEILGDYLETTFSKLLPEIIREAVKKNDFFIGQDLVSIKEAMRRYQLSRKTMYNYHNKQYITLRSSEGKRFVSIRELETHIQNNPLPRKITINEHC